MGKTTVIKTYNAPVTKRRYKKRKHYTAREVSSLVAMHNEGKTAIEIAAALGREEHSVRDKMIRVLGTSRPKGKPPIKHRERLSGLILVETPKHLGLVDRFWSWWHGRAAA